MANEAVESGASVVTMVIESRSPHETKSWGRRLASLLEGGELLGLIGDLGAGKTCFIKGLARGLNLREEDILSPTFTMIQEHHGRLPALSYRSVSARRGDARRFGPSRISCFPRVSRPSNGSSVCAAVPRWNTWPSESATPVRTSAGSNSARWTHVTRKLFPS